jgi:hypothetical protein
MKIVDIDVRSFNLTPGGVEDGTTTRDSMREFVKTNYTDQGWEILDSHVTHGNRESGAAVHVAFVFVKYADGGTNVKAK